MIWLSVEAHDVINITIFCLGRKMIPLDAAMMMIMPSNMGSYISSVPRRLSTAHGLIMVAEAQIY